MKILILEDETHKFNLISEEILNFNPDIKIDRSEDRTNFIKKLEREIEQNLAGLERLLQQDEISV